MFPPTWRCLLGTLGMSVLMWPEFYLRLTKTRAQYVLLSSCKAFARETCQRLKINCLYRYSAITIAWEIRSCIWRRGRRDFVDYLINSGVDPIWHSVGDTLVQSAVKGGNVGLVRLFLEYGNNPDDIDINKQTALFYASNIEMAVGEFWRPMRPILCA